MPGRTFVVFWSVIGLIAAMATALPTVEQAEAPPPKPAVNAGPGDFGPDVARSADLAFDGVMPVWRRSARPC